MTAGGVSVAVDDMESFVKVLVVARAVAGVRKALGLNEWDKDGILVARKQESKDLRSKAVVMVVFIVRTPPDD